MQEMFCFLQIKWLIKILKLLKPAKMKILILHNILKIEDPGLVKDLMIKDGAELKTIEPDEGEKIPQIFKV